jgi:hypothetical protein
MTNNLILLSVLVSAILTIYLFNWFINIRIKKRISESDKPITVQIFKAVAFLYSGLLLQEIIASFNTLTKVLPKSYTGENLLLWEVSYYCIFLGILIVGIILVFGVSSILFRLFSQGEKIFVEVANNNLPSVILFAGILFSLAIAIKAGITPVLDQFIPYPTMPVYR